MRKFILIGMLLFALGISAQSKQQLREELKEATEALSFRPDSIDLRLKKAALNMQLEQWEYALSEYDYVLRLDPENPAGLYPSNFEARLGLALLNQKDRHFTEAMDQINQLVEAYPNNAMVYVARANMERERKMYALAEYDFTQAIQLEPDVTDHLVNRADVRIMMENYEGAKADLDLLVKKGILKTALQDFYKRLK